MENVAEHLDRAPETPPSESGPVILRTAGLSRAFGRVHAVHDLNLEVRSGEIYGFLGVNGAGKTTTIRMLMGIVKPDAGFIEILGTSTRRTTLEQKQSIGYVSQEQNFYPWMTCRRLGQFVGSLYPTWDAAEFGRLLGVLQLPPDRKTAHLSGGMKVKLALALALAPRPALLILDEPTSGLDPLARREFLDIIQRQAREHRRTTFFSSHIIGEVERVADRVGIINNGHMLHEGGMGELRDTVRTVRVESPGETSTLPPIIGAEAASDTTRPDSMGSMSVSAPEGFKVLRDLRVEGARELTLQASPEAWAGAEFPGAEVRKLSVEDIFIAMVGTRFGSL